MVKVISGCHTPLNSTAPTAAASSTTCTPPSAPLSHTLRGAAVRFVLANHNVSAAVLGPRTKEQLEQLVRETGGGPRYIHDDDLRQLPRALDKIGIHT